MSANTDKLAEGQMYSNLATVYASLCSHQQENLDWSEMRKSLGETTQPHPVDTHPPLSVRLQSLKLSLDDIQPPEIAVPEHAACELVSNPNALEEELTLEDRYLAAIGAVVLPDTSKQDGQDTPASN